MFGYLLNIHTDAWLEFCKRENLTPSIGTQGLPGEDLHQRPLEEARAFGFSEKEAQQFAVRPVLSIESLKTMTNVADELHESYKLWVAKWE